MARVDGKVGIVTGAASGMGRATALALATAGAKVVAADLDGAAVQALAAEIGQDAVGIQVDVAEEADVERMIAAAVERFGRVDILHNNAAGVGPDVIGRDNDLHELDVETFDRTFAINVRGVFLGCKHALPHMLDQGSGSIVNVASVAALHADCAWSAYAASKAAVVSLTQSVASNYGTHGVRCNAIAPGLIVTKGNQQVITPEHTAIFQRHTPAPRLGRLEDVAAVVLFLGSDESFYVNGHCLVVDGGMTAHLPHWRDATDYRDGGR
jgi:NAD(P)-dependent dehydrogenase (short-subunit alcohol dehydrogenase family)